MVENIRHKGLALLILAGAQFMVILDATIVNVALPSIQKALGFNGKRHGAAAMDRHRLHAGVRRLPAAGRTPG